MFGRLLKTLASGLGEAAATPTRDPEAELLAVPDPALRQLFASRYNGAQAEQAAFNGGHAEYWAEVRRMEAATHAAAFAGDPLPLSLTLIELSPRWVAWRHKQPATPERARLDGALTNALEAGLAATQSFHGARWPLTPARLASALLALGELAAFGFRGRAAQSRWLGTLIAEAVKRDDAASRRALVAMFDALLRCAPHQLNDNLTLTEQLLPASGLDRREIAELAAADARDAQRDAARGRLFAELGAPLAAGLEAILNGDRVACAMSLPEAVKHPALRAVADLSPTERGVAFHRLVKLIARDLNGIGDLSWGELQKKSGRYSTLPGMRGMPTQVGNLLGVLASRKIELVDADADIACLLEVLRHFPLLGYKKIVELILAVVAAHPHGRAATALRAAVAPDRDVHALRDHKLAIEDLLRTLPALGPAPESGGFGRKGMNAGPILQGLSPTALPAFAIDDWYAPQEIGGHFGNLFDARLYEASHRDLLGRLAALARDLAATGDGQTVSAETRARMHRFVLKGDHDHHRQANKIASSAKLGAELHARFDAAAPFVAAYPKAARALGRLAADLDGKAQPSAKWLTEARTTIGAVPVTARTALIAALVATPTPTTYLGVNGDHIRALLFVSGDVDPAVLGPLLTDYALKRCYVTLPGIGIRNEKIGNACLWALANLPDGAGVPYLARILARTKYPKIKAKVDTRLNEAAAKAGIDRATLDELTVPTHDLSADGTRTVALGDGTATIRIAGGRAAAIDWAGAAGKPLKAPSVAMKADAEALKAVKAAAKELEADLSVQPQRLQQLYLADRHWSAEVWRERYLDHPLLRALATRLIWWVERDGARVGAMPDSDTMVDAAGAPVALDGATVRLWHPIDASAAEIEAWRGRLEALALTQPFAQAWREVYVLTDAERTTATYSNRWAAHLLKQHQAMTLARINGWRVTHRGGFDVLNNQPWHLPIPAYGLVVDYWVEGAGGDDAETSDSGAYTYVATDRVQFHAVEGDDGSRGRAAPLVELPPIVFSEVMRHCDLFTAVASIAADPNWLDRGGDAAHPNRWGQAAAAYWTRTNGAALEESGKRRRAMLERIVPRLKIAAKLALDDRYLTVEGTRHRYRIHIGSGACFHGERHICIVPASEPETGRLWLPFEGDRTLSIILSKAALLAADEKITDRVILAQL